VGWVAISCGNLWVSTDFYGGFNPAFGGFSRMQAETPHPQRCDALCLADVTWLKFARGDKLT